MVPDRIAALVAEQFRQEREDITEDTVFEEPEAANALTTVGDPADVVEEALGLR